LIASVLPPGEKQLACVVKYQAAVFKSQKIIMKETFAIKSTAAIRTFIVMVVLSAAIFVGNQAGIAEDFKADSAIVQWRRSPGARR